VTLRLSEHFRFLDRPPHYGAVCASVRLETPPRARWVVGDAGTSDAVARGMTLFNIYNVLMVLASIAALIVFFAIQLGSSHTARPASSPPTRGYGY
jgi:hypothetical protein